MAGYWEAVEKNFTGGDAFDRSAKELHKSFMKEMNYMAEDDTYIPKLSSMDMKYNFLLQKNRAAEYGVGVKSRCITDERSYTGVSALMGSDKRYVTRIPVTACRFEKEYFSGNKRIKRERYGGTISSYVVFAQTQDPGASYCCPNCGDINKVSQLLEQGCRSCRTKFMMPDLYPRITYYYSQEEKPYHKTTPLPFVLLGILSAVIFFFLYSSKQLEIGFEYYFALMVTAVCGIVFGYIFYALGMIFLVILDGIRSSSRCSAYNKTKRELPGFMQNYDPFFAVDFFAGKVNSLLKTLIFTDNYKNCSVYEKDGDNPYKDIVDVDYQGAIGLNNAVSDGRYVYIDVDVYARTAFMHGRRLKHRDEVFNMKLCRSVNVHDDCNASVHNIECRSCGASFNAVREKNCPYCRSAYNLRDYDWIVTDFERKTG